MTEGNVDGFTHIIVQRQVACVQRNIVVTVFKAFREKLFFEVGGLGACFRH